MERLGREDCKWIGCTFAFLFIFIILVAAITTTCYDQQNFGALSQTENFVNGYTLDTLKNKILQGKYYKALSPHDDLMFYLVNEHKPALVAILANWCGFCQRLKRSNVLAKVANKVPVYVIDDQHPAHTKIMQTVKSPGFPTLAIFANNKFHPYQGPQEPNAIVQAVMNGNQLRQSDE